MTMIRSSEGRRVRARLRLAHYLLAGGSGVLIGTGQAMAQAHTAFVSGFMRQGPDQAADAGQLALQAIANEQGVLPGRYRVQVRLNQQFMGEHDIEFIEADSAALSPCLNRVLLDQFGVNVEGVADAKLLEHACIDLPRLIAGARSDFDAALLQLDLSVPQLAMRRKTAGYVDPQRWDYGINAAFLNYQVSAQQGTTRYAGHNDSQDLLLNGGINLGAWRLRTNQSARQDSAGGSHWTRAYTYAQRDLPGMHANLTLGEAFSGGDVFKSVALKGVMLNSDSGMLPDVLQNYSPVVRGVAFSRARLEVRQGGFPIYATYVSAGPFEIDDLNTGGGSGELEIILTEADGQVRRFTQPYASLGNLLRENVWKYSAAIGRYNATGHIDDPLLWQGTLATGIGWGATLYGGLQASEYYQAANLGAARDWGAMGALALDVTRSSADIDTQDIGSVQGLSYAIKYGKTFDSRTSLRFAGYRYSTEGYRDFDEAVRQRSLDSTFRGSRRSRLEASLYQGLGQRSSLGLTLSQEDFWRSDYQLRQFQFNFNTRHQGVNYSLYAGQSLRSSQQSSDRQMGLSVSFPLDIGHTSSVNLDLQKTSQTLSQRASVTGSMDQNRLGYRAGVVNEDGRQQAAELSMSYQMPTGNVGAGLNYGSAYRNLSVNAAGAVVLHGDGVEFGPYLGETAGLVEVPGVKNVGIVSSPGVRTNARGYALVPYLRPYRVNQIELDTDELGPDIELDNGTTQVVPRRGALVKHSFAARSVQRVVITATFQGRPLPFGAQVKDARGQTVAVVGQGGVALLNTDGHPQALDVAWGDEPGQQCRLSIAPQDMTLSQGYRLQSADCQ
ncbi:ferrous iron transporter B [Pseudomonas chlororaphis]|uniref:Ferrous iron transporter B n=1 Tax=Pseudomonas chlororaphis TaxID=587753 RepID=A0A0G3GBF8_9PSED|nr:ferrous iron transporter B [Pseudomonas chlororaphis]